jgi:hypothetical protein
MAILGMPEAARTERDKILLEQYSSLSEKVDDRDFDKDKLLTEGCRWLE